MNKDIEMGKQRKYSEVPRNSMRTMERQGGSQTTETLEKATNRLTFHK